MSELAITKPVDVSSTKDMFVSAFRIAMSLDGSCSTVGDGLIRTSAQEQIQFMIGEGESEYAATILADNEMKTTVRMGVSDTFCSFKMELSSLLFSSLEETKIDRIFRRVSDLEWICNIDILPKMDLMKHFVYNWATISGKNLGVVEDDKLDDVMWDLKVKLMGITGKVLEAVADGKVILPAPCRLQLLKTWIPYVRNMRPSLDLKAIEDGGFPYNMDKEQLQCIEEAIVSLLLTLSSNDQADILDDWFRSEYAQYPNLNRAFETWCYRAKFAKRRLVKGLETLEGCS